MQMIVLPGLRMPRIGLGTWPLRGAACKAAVQGALAIGYRHIDTAGVYGNEDAVGAGIAAGGVPRGDIFLTTKVWYDSADGAAIRAAFLASLARLGTPYVDLLMIHWPSPALDLPDALGTLAALRAEGLARAIGVSNFPAGLLRRAIALDVGLACLQVECHALLDQSALLGICRANNMALVAYSPLGRGEVAMHPMILRIAAKHGATGGQVALSWLLSQPGVAMVPKAASAPRQAENLGAPDVVLDAVDLAAIAALPKDRRFVDPDFAPDWGA